MKPRAAEILELDLNPVMALPPGHGCRIVDARVKVGHRPRRDGAPIALGKVSGVASNT